MGHMPRTRKEDIAILFGAMAEASPIIRPADRTTADSAAYRGTLEVASQALPTAAGLPLADRTYRGWLGLLCPDTKTAIWLMRALVASNVLARREETTLFVPVNPVDDPDASLVAARLARVRRFATIKGVV
jgi:hypothetical protein